MVQTCFIQGCKCRFDRNKRISFFHFPSDENESQKWRDAILQLNNQYCDKISKHSKICEIHFNESDINRNGSRCVLKKGAEPTLFPIEESRGKKALSQSIETSNTSNEFMDIEYLYSEDEVSEGELMNVECSGLPQSDAKSVELNNFEDDQAVSSELKDVERLGLSQSYEKSVELKNVSNDRMSFEPQSKKSIQELPKEQRSVDGTIFVCQNCGYCNSTSGTSVLHEECNVTSRWIGQSPEFLQDLTAAQYEISDCNTTPKTSSVEPNNPCLIDNRVFIEDIENESIDPPRRGTKRRLHYPGDVKENEDLTPRSSKKFIRNLKKTVTKQRVKIQNLNKKKRRALSRISSLKSLVSELKRKNLVSENALESLKVLHCTFKCVVKQYLSRFRQEWLTLLIRI